MGHHKLAAVLLTALTAAGAERAYLTERVMQMNGQTTSGGAIVVSGRSSTGATFVHNGIGFAFLRFPDGAEQRVRINVAKKTTFYLTRAEMADVERTPESDCLKSPNGHPTMFASIAGREVLLGIATVKIRSVTPSARSMEWRVPSAGCVLVQTGIEFLDPATGRIGSTTTERMTKFEFKEPEAKWFDSSSYEEVKPSVADHAEILFNTRGRGPGRPLDDNFAKMMERVDASYKRKKPYGRTRNGL